MKPRRGADPELRRELAVCHREAFAWALSCCRRDRIEAEDVLQTAYLKVLDGSARFDGRSSFTTWLFSVIRRTAADRRRRRFLRDLLAGRWAADQVDHDPAPAADACAEDAQERLQLTRALTALSTRQRQVLQLVFYHDLSVLDAARIMGIGVGAARQHYARGKARLRALLTMRATP